MIDVDYFALFWYQMQQISFKTHIHWIWYIVPVEKRLLEYVGSWTAVIYPLKAFKLFPML